MSAFLLLFFFVAFFFFNCYAAAKSKYKVPGEDRRRNSATFTLRAPFLGRSYQGRTLRSSAGGGRAPAPARDAPARRSRRPPSGSRSQRCLLPVIFNFLLLNSTTFWGIFFDFDLFCFIVPVRPGMRRQRSPEASVIWAASLQPGLGKAAFRAGQEPQPRGSGGPLAPRDGAPGSAGSGLRLPLLSRSRGAASGSREPPPLPPTAPARAASTAADWLSPTAARFSIGRSAPLGPAPRRWR